MKTFAAIDVGSYELSMKVFEFSGKNRMREIDHVRHRIDLGTETYSTGKLSYEKVDELCRVLSEFVRMMKSYEVDAYKAYGTSAIREMENSGIVLDQIEQKTGIRIGVLSNSEQRFFDFKSIASKGEEFDRFVEEGTVVLDIGGGSIQISLFENGTLITTQNLKLGVLRLRERLNRMQARASQLEELLGEMDDAQLSILYKLYLKDREIKHIILVDDYLSGYLPDKDADRKSTGYCTDTEYTEFMTSLRSRGIANTAYELGITEDNAVLMLIGAVLLNRLVQMTGAKLIWSPGVTLCDGIAYDYADRQKMDISNHDFEKDILSCARNISKRYMGSKKRGETLEVLTLTIFDSMKKLHGLGKRERLYLQIAAILHDCGKYISMINLGECCYQIIMATEIVGLSHMEREIIANVVKFNHDDFLYYETLRGGFMLDKQAYLIIAKLTAILRIANGLDRSHKQKFTHVNAILKDKELILSADTKEDITLEKGLFQDREQFFEEVYNVKPVIRLQKK